MRIVTSGLAGVIVGIVMSACAMALSGASEPCSSGPMVARPRCNSLAMRGSDQSAAEVATVRTVLRRLAEEHALELGPLRAGLDALEPYRYVAPDVTPQAMAAALKDTGNAAVLLGNTAAAHPRASLLRALATAIADAAGAVHGCLPPAANSACGLEAKRNPVAP